jgi:hypothetical protein
MKALQWRRVVSLALLLLAAVLTFTGVMLYISPTGRIAHWSHWSLLGLDKGQLESIHTVSSFAFVILGWLHTWYNWKPILAYLKDKARRLRVATPEMIVASVLVFVLVVGSGASLPPFVQVMDAGDAIKDWWEEREGSPPWGHAELASVKTVAGKLGMEVEDAVAALESEGWVVDSPKASLLELSHQDSRSPAALYRVLEGAQTTEEPASGEASEAAAEHTPKSSGLGKRSLRAHCESEGLALEAAIVALEGLGVSADPDASLKELAGALGSTPRDLSAQLAEALEAGDTP